MLIIPILCDQIINLLVTILYFIQHFLLLNIHSIHIIEHVNLILIAFSQQYRILFIQLWIMIRYQFTVHLNNRIDLLLDLVQTNSLNTLFLHLFIFLVILSNHTHFLPELVLQLQHIHHNLSYLILIYCPVIILNCSFMFELNRTINSSQEVNIHQVSSIIQTGMSRYL